MRPRLKERWRCPLPFDKPCSFRAVRLRLESLGFLGISQTANHAKFIRSDGTAVRTAVLPHYTELTVSVLKSIARQAGLKEEELLG